MTGFVIIVIFSIAAYLVQQLHFVPWVSNLFSSWVIIRMLLAVYNLADTKKNLLTFCHMLDTMLSVLSM
jgi:hypothetical protein